ncbi:MAG: sigma-70 family RNA polymerase sigma factor [Lentisphaeria bacterium]|nr:sigma-70 family RNA polymerase sigma factor [Lentisphaeria bacterium]
MKNQNRTPRRKHGYTTDSGLLTRMAAEEEQAWIDFDNKYRSMILAVGKQRGIAPDDCEDLVQEVMLVCCRRISRFFYDRSKGRFRSYLYAVIKHSAWRMLRQEAPDAPEPPLEYEEGIDRIFMEEYERFLTDSVLALLRERVSTQTYSAFEMLAIQQLPVKEVSQITRKTPAALYLIRHRCMRILRQCIEEIPEAADRIHSRGSSSRKA